jgi:hypothetical protein
VAEDKERRGPVIACRAPCPARCRSFPATTTCSARVGVLSAVARLDYSFCKEMVECMLFISSRPPKLRCL